MMKYDSKRQELFSLKSALTSQRKPHRDKRLKIGIKAERR